MGKKICRYCLDFYRSANLEGVFVLTDTEYEALGKLNGKPIYYGEVAGKHSDVNRDFKFDSIEVLSDKEEEVAFFERVLPDGAGYCFKEKWFDSCRAFDNGYEAGGSKIYTSAEEALDDYPYSDNDISRPTFVEGFNERRNKA